MNTQGQEKSKTKQTKRTQKLLAILLSVILFISIVPMGTLSFISHAITPYKTNVDVYNDVNTVETITQYRYRTKSYKTSNSSSLSGWTLRNDVTNPTVSYGSWQTQPDTTTRPTESEGLQIINSWISSYNYYHYCCNYYDNQNNVDSISCGSGSHHYHTTSRDSALSPSGVPDKGGQQAYGGQGSGAPSCSSGFYIWFLGSTTYTYRYQTRSVTRTYYYYQWSAWSDWSDTPVEATNEKDVQTRTVHIDEYGIRYNENYSEIYRVPEDLNCKVFNIPASVKTIANNAFENCSKIKAINYHSAIATIGSKAFYGCSAIEEINIPSSVSSIGANAFSNCTSLSSVYFNHKNPPSIGSTPFSNTGLSCIYVYFLDLKDSWLEHESSWAGYPLKGYNPPGQLYSDIDSNNRDDQGFQYTYDASSKTATVVGYSGGSNAIIPRRIVKDSVSYYVKSFTSDVFRGKTSLTSVSITKDITSIPAQAFKGCTSLQSVYYEGTLVSLGQEAFSGCSSLTSFDYLRNLSVIPDNAFYGCSSLRTVSLPSSLTSIEASAFSGCSSIGDVSIPSNVATIGANAFYGCSNITTVTFNGTVASIGNNAFANCPNLIKAWFKTNPPSACDSNIFSDNSNFFISYPNNNATWNSQVNNYLWRGYNAYTASMISQVGDGSRRPMIIKVVSYNGAPVRNATVTFNGVTHQTISDGTAMFSMPLGNSAGLYINPNNVNFETYSNNNYPLNKRQTLFVVQLGANHSIAGVTVNGTSVFTSHIPLNTNYTGYSTFSVRVQSPLRITKLEILSGNNVVAKKTSISSGTYSFNIKHTSLRAYSNVMVRMTTEDGKITQRNLNISTFATNACDFTLSAGGSDPEFNMASTGHDILKSVSLKIPISSWLKGAKITVENTPTSIKFGINSPHYSFKEREILAWLQGNTQKVYNSKASFGVRGGVGGTIEFAYNVNSNSLYISNYAMYAYGEVYGSKSIDFYIVYFPLTLQFDLSGKLKVSVEQKMTFLSNGQAKVNITPKATVTVDGKVSFGLGNSLVSAGIYGGLTFDWEIPSKLFGSGRAGAYVKLACMRYEKEFWNWQKKQLLPRSRTTMKSPKLADYYDSSLLTPISRNYLSY